MRVMCVHIVASLAFFTYNGENFCHMYEIIAKFISQVHYLISVNNVLLVCYERVLMLEV